MFFHIHRFTIPLSRRLSSDPSQLKSGAVVEVLYRSGKPDKQVLAYHARILDNVGDVVFYVH